jgi:BirA family transcriptional regulator, biotin operon repressor / biotin---[acetyl-CoA-carboxylase] ligase
MSCENFSDAAAQFPDPYRLLVRETCASTNDEVRTLALAGAPHGLIILAENQTAGRGRRGAAWFSPAGESLAFSILIRPDAPKSLWPRLALATGLAVAEALESFQLKPGIKWPNDLWLSGKKVAGILVETGSDFAIVGIGLNVNSTQFPTEVSAIATSMSLEAGREFSRAAVLEQVVHAFARRQSQIGEHFPEVIAALASRCALTGHAVRLIDSNGPRLGKVQGISPGGELMLLTEQGLERFIQADEIRLTD